MQFSSIVVHQQLPLPAAGWATAVAAVRSHPGQETCRQIGKDNSTTYSRNNLIQTSYYNLRSRYYRMLSLTGCIIYPP